MDSFLFPRVGAAFFHRRAATVRSAPRKVCVVIGVFLFRVRAWRANEPQAMASVARPNGIPMIQPQEKEFEIQVAAPEPIRIRHGMQMIWMRILIVSYRHLSPSAL